MQLVETLFQLFTSERMCPADRHLEDPQIGDTRVEIGVRVGLWNTILDVATELLVYSRCCLFERDLKARLTN